jgi:uncharacterized protein
MKIVLDLLCYLVFGIVGGYFGAKLKIPAGALIGALLCVVLAKFFLRADWELPKTYDFFLQVAIGVMVAATFHHSMLPMLGKIILPVFASTFFLIATGVVLSMVFTRLGLGEIGTNFLGTSPGAMSVLVVLAVDNNANTAAVTCFHFVRIVAVVLTAPVLLKHLTN